MQSSSYEAAGSPSDLMKITVVANESGDIIAAVVHAFEPPSADDPDAIRVKPSPTQSAVTVDAPPEVANRRPDAEFLGILRRNYTIKDGSLTRK